MQPDGLVRDILCQINLWRTYLCISSMDETRMPLSDWENDDQDEDRLVSRAVYRLREIARILGRPVSDFFDSPAAESPQQRDDEPERSGND